MASNDTASIPPKDSAVGDSSPSGKKKLRELYPVNSVLKLTLSPTNEVVEGLVYTTDEISNMIVLKKSLNYTTLASEIRMVNAVSVAKKEVVTLVAASSGSSGEELSIPLTNISKKTIEEREKRARKLAEESIRQINQKASPEGQAIFDRLLKACNEVAWKGEDIIVLNQIRVVPPYGSDNCKLINSGGDVKLNEGSLERVKRIVAG